MSLRNKFDENMKSDSKLLITEATFGFFCFAVKTTWSYLQLFCHNTIAFQTTDRQTTFYDNSRTLQCNCNIPLTATTATTQCCNIIYLQFSWCDFEPWKVPFVTATPVGHQWPLDTDHHWTPRQNTASSHCYVETLTSASDLCFPLPGLTALIDINYISQSQRLLQINSPDSLLYRPQSI